MALNSPSREILARCQALARITDVPGETTRTFLSPAMRLANKQLMDWAGANGFSHRYDAAGNLRILRKAAQPTGRTFLLASHLDTVPNAGAYDGPLGIVIGLALLEAAAPLPYNLELVAFSEEEGVRFGFPFIGSRALTGELSEDLLARTDRDGISVKDAIAAYGLDPGQLSAAKIDAGYFGYLEFHIEQGPVLEHEQRALGVVHAIIGQSRYELSFTGSANHAGTTPMHLRRDALTAASEFVLKVESLARETANLVATVGSLKVSPGAGNVIPGSVTLTLDIRHADDAVRHRAVETLFAAAEQLARDRGLAWEKQLRMDQAAVPMDPALTRLLLKAAPSGTLAMSSGAGHDAMIVAPRIPAAMCFLRTPGGLSHHPDETVLPGDVELAFETGMRFLALLAEEETHHV